MGTRGRDAAIWLFFLTAGTIVLAVIMGWDTAGVFLYLIMLALAALFFKFNFYDVQKGIKNSQVNGLKTIILLPINRTWAGWLTRKRLGVCDYAYEIHFEPEKINLHEKLTGRLLIKAIETDLLFIKQNMQGLFLWETSISIPHSIRSIIKTHQANGRAVWERGWWRVPHIPFVSRNKNKKPLRKGAIKL